MKGVLKKYMPQVPLTLRKPSANGFGPARAALPVGDQYRAKESSNWSPELVPRPDSLPNCNENWLMSSAQWKAKISPRSCRLALPNCSTKTNELRVEQMYEEYFFI